MTITLTLDGEIEECLLAKARARGMALQEYLQTVVEHEALPPGREREAAVRRMLEFGEKYRLSPDGPTTRESLHEGHRY